MAGDNESSIVVNDAHLAIRDVFGAKLPILLSTLPYVLTPFFN